MRWLLFSFLFVVFSCKSQQEKVQGAVSAYIVRYTERPDSYEPLSWQMGKNENGTIHVRHKYRCFDPLQQMKINDGFFEVDSHYLVTEISPGDY